MKNIFKLYEKERLITFYMMLDEWRERTKARVSFENQSTNSLKDRLYYRKIDGCLFDIDLQALVAELEGLPFNKLKAVEALIGSWQEGFAHKFSILLSALILAEDDTLIRHFAAEFYISRYITSTCCRFMVLVAAYHTGNIDLVRRIEKLTFDKIEDVPELYGSVYQKERVQHMLQSAANGGIETMRHFARLMFGRTKTIRKKYFERGIWPTDSTKSSYKISQDHVAPTFKKHIIASQYKVTGALAFAKDEKVMAFLLKELIPTAFTRAWLAKEKFYQILLRDNQGHMKRLVTLKRWGALLMLFRCANELSGEEKKSRPPYPTPTVMMIQGMRTNMPLELFDEMLTSYYQREYGRFKKWKKKTEVPYPGFIDSYKIAWQPLLQLVALYTHQPYQEKLKEKFPLLFDSSLEDYIPPATIVESLTLEHFRRKLEHSEAFRKAVMSSREFSRKVLLNAACAKYYVYLLAKIHCAGRDQKTVTEIINMPEDVLMRSVSYAELVDERVVKALLGDAITIVGYSVDFLVWYSLLVREHNARLHDELFSENLPEQLCEAFLTKCQQSLPKTLFCHDLSAMIEGLFSLCTTMSADEKAQFVIECISNIADGRPQRSSARVPAPLSWPSKKKEAYLVGLPMSVRLVLGTFTKAHDVLFLLIVLSTLQSHKVSQHKFHIYELLREAVDSRAFISELRAMSTQPELFQSIFYYAFQVRDIHLMTHLVDNIKSIEYLKELKLPRITTGHGNGVTISHLFLMEAHGNSELCEFYLENIYPHLDDSEKPDVGEVHKRFDTFMPTLKLNRLLGVNNNTDALITACMMACSSKVQKEEVERICNELLQFITSKAFDDFLTSDNKRFFKTESLRIMFAFSLKYESFDILDILLSKGLLEYIDVFSGMRIVSKSSQEKSSDQLQVHPVDFFQPATSQAAHSGHVSFVTRGTRMANFLEAEKNVYQNKLAIKYILSKGDLSLIQKVLSHLPVTKALSVLYSCFIVQRFGETSLRDLIRNELSRPEFLDIDLATQPFLPVRSSAGITGGLPCLFRCLSGFIQEHVDILDLDDEIIMKFVNHSMSSLDLYPIRILSVQKLITFLIESDVDDSVKKSLLTKADLDRPSDSVFIAMHPLIKPAFKEAFFFFNKKARVSDPKLFRELVRGYRAPVTVEETGVKREREILTTSLPTSSTEPAAKRTRPPETSIVACSTSHFHPSTKREGAEVCEEEQPKTKKSCARK